MGSSELPSVFSLSHATKQVMTQSRWSFLLKDQENTRMVPVAEDFNTKKNASPSLAYTETSQRTCFLISEVILHSKQSTRELGAQASKLM